MKNRLIGVLIISFAVICFSLVNAEAMVIVEKGIPRAKIVIAQQPTRTAEYAAKEFRDYIRKISGAELQIERAGGYTGLRGDINYVFVGPSIYTKNLGIRVDNLKPDGFRIVSGNNWLALVGRDYKGKPVYPYGETGSLYAVYNFLKDFLGVRWFMPGEIGEVVPKQQTITVKTVNYKKEPDFTYRRLYSLFYSPDPADAVWYKRLGFGGAWNVDINHSFWRFYRAHPDYKYKYPEIFSLVDGKRQTETPPEREKRWGEGNFDLSNPLTLRLWVKHIREYFNKYPERKIYPVVPNDVMYIKGWSQDARSRAQYDLDKPFDAQYSNYVWKFVNDVAREVYKTHPDRWIGGLAYEQYREPPSRIDKLSPNVAVMITKRRCNYWDRDYRKRMNLFIDEWKKKASRIYIWEYYNYYFREPFKMQYPLDGIPVIFSHVISEDLKRLKGISGGEFIEAETSAWREKGQVRRGRTRKSNERRFSDKGKLHLMFYLTGSLLWDADQDVDELLDDYYTKFYGPASEEMKKFFTRAEELWMNPDKNKKNNLRLLYTDDVINELWGYLNQAKAKAGNTIYGRRVAIVASEFIKPRKGKATDNLLENPGFEDSGKVTGWRLLNAKGFPARLEIVTSPQVAPHSGKNSLMIIPGISQEKRYRSLIANFNPIPVKDGTKIKYSLWIKGFLEGESPHVSIVFYRYNKEGKGLGGQWVSAPLRKFSGGWQKIEGVVTIRDYGKWRNRPPRKGVDPAVASVLFTVDVIGKGKIYIDDAKAVLER